MSAQFSRSSSTAAAVAEDHGIRPPRYRLWPLWAVAAGVLGVLATLIFGGRPESEVRGTDITISAATMSEIPRFENYLGFVTGFTSVAALVIFQAAWRARVEVQYPNLIAARLVSGGLLVAAAGLALAYGWKGAMATYGHGGAEFGMFPDEGLFIYFMLTDFSPYIPWFGVVLSALGLAWLAWVDRVVSRGLGTVAAIVAALVGGGYVISGVPGLAGIVAGPLLVIVGVWLSVGRSRITQRVDA